MSDMWPEQPASDKIINGSRPVKVDNNYYICTQGTKETDLTPENTARLLLEELDKGNVIRVNNKSYSRAWGRKLNKENNDGKIN